MIKDHETIIATGGHAWVRRFEGLVLHVDRRQELHVSAAGGGGLVGPNGGFVEAPSVSSTSTDHQTLFLRDDRGTEQSFEIRNWHISARPGNRLAVVWGSRIDNESGSVLAVRNLHTGEERWKDVQDWARGQNLLTGKMLFWPSIVAALILGLAFVTLVSYAQTRTFASGPEYGSKLALAASIAFAPAIVLEWFLVVAMRVGDAEHVRIKDLLTDFLRTGKMD